MVARRKLNERNLKERLKQGYFAGARPLTFCRSGCTLLDLVLGGGWAMGRIANVIGDRSSGKTLLAIEAATNFARDYPTGSIWYRESEAAFDSHYAAALGMPLDRVKLDRIDTVEAMFADMEMVLATAPKPCLYILDSLDALTDKAEMARTFGTGYGTDKAAALSELFRRLVATFAEVGMTLLMLSQIRSNVSAKFPGAKGWTRSGGRALDFYASQIIFLRQTATIYREHTISGQKIKRAVGIAVNARAEKNKVGMPFRQADFELIFGYGVDDYKAQVAFLDDNKGLGMLGDIKPTFLLKALRENTNPDLRPQTRAAVEKLWNKIETAFLPAHGKYE